MEQSAERVGAAIHFRRLLLLWLIILAPRLLAINGAVAPARDMLKYITAAGELRDYTFQNDVQPAPGRPYYPKPLLGFQRALQLMDAHPLYPAALLGAHSILVAAGAADGPLTWVHAGQTVSVLSYMAFLTAAYAAGARLWNSRTAWFGCILVSILPRQIGYSVDLLSDGLHAAFWTTGLALLAGCWNRPKLTWFALAGIAAGLAYWTRPEGLTLPLIASAAFLLTICIPSWRPSLRRALPAMALFLICFGLLGGGYAYTIGGLSQKNSTGAVLGTPTRSEPIVPKETRLPALAGAPLPLPRLAEPVDLVPRSYVRDENYQPTPFATGVKVLSFEIAQESRVWLLVLAVVGMLDLRTRRLHWPAGTLLVFSWLAFIAMLILLQMRAGYLAGRYLTPLMPYLAMTGVLGVEVLLAWIVRTPRTGWETSWTLEKWRMVRRNGVLTGVAAVACVSCASAWFTPLHRHRQAYLEAARWLAEHSAPQEQVFDPLSFVSFFADRPRWLPSSADGPIPVRFAIIDAERVYRTEPINHAIIKRFNELGRPVAKFVQPKANRDAALYIFELPPATAQKSASGTEVR